MASDSDTPDRLPIALLPHQWILDSPYLVLNLPCLMALQLPLRKKKGRFFWFSVVAVITATLQTMWHIRSLHWPNRVLNFSFFVYFLNQLFMIICAIHLLPFPIFKGRRKLWDMLPESMYPSGLIARPAVFTLGFFLFLTKVVVKEDMVSGDELKDVCGNESGGGYHLDSDRRCYLFGSTPYLDLESLHNPSHDDGSDSDPGSGSSNGEIDGVKPHVDESDPMSLATLVEGFYDFRDLFLENTQKNF